MGEYRYWDWCNSCANKETFERCVGCARPEDGTNEPSEYRITMRRGVLVEELDKKISAEKEKTC